MNQEFNKKRLSGLTATDIIVKDALSTTNNKKIQKVTSMGLLDKNITITFLEGKVSLEDLFELLKEKLGNKYEVKFLKKGSAAAQFFGTGNAEDRIFVAKNAYHH